MCGIAGAFTGPGSWRASEARATLQAMGDALAHRGPDGDGIWDDSAEGVGLVHRRLAIVDLSPTGAQPMFSASRRYVLTFNGEIYNYRALRAELPGPWRGTSDTEVLLRGFDQWGIEQTLRRAIGMFAFALWDGEARHLILARDRFGEKPLYYGWQGRGPRRTFLFGSELAALRTHPAFEGEVDRAALSDLVRDNNVGGSASIYAGIAKLPPGCILTLSAESPEPTVTRYWSTLDEVARATDERWTGTPAEAADRLEALLREAIRDQMVADVPLGAFLSGGIDSSLVTALMQAEASTPVKTYSIGFGDAAFDEAPYARAVAEHLRTDHTELYVSPADALAVATDIPRLFSEPFADSSQIPTYLLARLTREHVTVALSGDCGDELFGGYNRYRYTASHWRRLSRIPSPLRRIAGGALNAVPIDWLDKTGGLGLLGRVRRAGEAAHKMADALGSATLPQLHDMLVAQWRDPAAMVIGGTDGRSDGDGAAAYRLAGLEPVEQMMAADVMGYMCDDILAKVDRCAMAVSLETRVPYLDPRVAAFAWRLPLDLKLRAGETKWILRQILHRHVPRALIERPKSGFALPLGQWLRGPLRDWAEALLDAGALASGGYLRPAPIVEAWRLHLSGRRDCSPQLWTILMFQAWLSDQVPSPQAGAHIPRRSVG